MRIAIGATCMLVGLLLGHSLPWSSQEDAQELVEEVRGMRIAESEALINTLKAVCEQQGRAWTEAQAERGPSYTCHALSREEINADTREVLDAGASTYVDSADFKAQVRECTRSGRTAVTRQLRQCFALVCVSHRAAQAGPAAARVTDEIEACAAKGTAL